MMQKTYRSLGIASSKGRRKKIENWFPLDAAVKLSRWWEKLFFCFLHFDMCVYVCLYVSNNIKRFYGSFVLVIQFLSFHLKLFFFIFFSIINVFWTFLSSLLPSLPLFLISIIFAHFIYCLHTISINIVWKLLTIHNLSVTNCKSKKRREHISIYFYILLFFFAHFEFLLFHPLFLPFRLPNPLPHSHFQFTFLVEH